MGWLGRESKKSLFGLWGDIAYDVLIEWSENTARLASTLKMDNE